MAKATASRVLVQELHACIDRHRKELEELLTKCSVVEPSKEPKAQREVTDASWRGDDVSEGPAPRVPPANALPSDPSVLDSEHGIECVAADVPLEFGKELVLELNAELCPIQSLSEEQIDKEHVEEVDAEHHTASSVSAIAGAVVVGEKNEGKEETGEERMAENIKKPLTFNQRITHADGMHYQDNCMARVVKHRRFDQLCAIFIVLASILVGIEVEYKTTDNTWMFDLLGNLTLVWFTSEIIIRMIARGRRYISGSDRSWNIFDCFCVASSYIEIVVSAFASNQGSFLLILRTLRVIRIARIVRVVRFLTHLRMMVNTMFGAVKMLGWAMLLLTMAMYMFAVSFTEATKPLLTDPMFNSEKRELLETYFPNLVVTVVTLFSSISGGVSWELPLAALAEINVLYAVMFLFYISLVVFAMLNVITGLCCDYAIQNCVSEREDIIRAKKVEKDNLMKQFQAVFQVIDHGDGHQDGYITADELIYVVEDEDFRAYLAHLHVSLEDVVDIFEIFDKNGDGHVSLDEFVDGCMKVKGPAKTVDVMRLMKMSSQVLDRLNHR
eukprot:TRINITY_DN44696_c0_g1_i1.p1 TRINITY_DN44696_c0_g1~~TRINITY_DN44696_c0_g1_i1.p1  ORF type:complete len:556 (-),score=94.19 TRINITY_DN44696_c0_g1_i1:123-1790(-)